MLMKMSKKIGAISCALVVSVILLGLGIAVYATYHNKVEETKEVFNPIEEVLEQGEEVNEQVTEEEEEEYLKYLDEEEQEEKDKKDKKEEENEPSSLPYYIKVNYRAQTVTVYGQDENGEYTKPVIAFVCSTGTDTPTSGVYPLKAKYRWINLKGNVYGQYSSRIVGSILFHSVYYYEKFNPGTLCYTGYDKLGSKASAGCVRLNVASAKWIYDNCPVGTKVEFYASSDPGPLGKPGSQRISSNETCRGWDPTDPDPRNPWHTYVEPTAKPEEPEVIPTPQPIPEPTPAPTPDPNVPIIGIELSKSKLELEIGEEEIIKVTINPKDADIEKTEWKSSKEDVATVIDGKIKAKGKGKTTVTVTITDKDGNTITKECEVTVKETVDDNDMVNNTTINTINGLI